MKERPILFSGAMVRAILDGSKTQTRRVVKPQPPAECGIHYMLGNESWLAEADRKPLRHTWEAWHGPLFQNRPDKHLCGIHDVISPYGAPGDRLWVRETWNSNGLNWGKPIREMHKGFGPIHYAATDKGEWKKYWGPWKPSIHMPRWACRLVLEITDVRVERLNDCSEDDARAEGIGPLRADGSMEYGVPASDGFADLWESINGPGSWDVNPWVWVVEFKRVMP